MGVFGEKNKMHGCKLHFVIPKPTNNDNSLKNNSRNYKEMQGQDFNGTHAHKKHLYDSDIKSGGIPLLSPYISA